MPDDILDTTEFDTAEYRPPGRGFTEQDFGPRLRSIRLRRGATLKSIAGQADISASFLSQVERGIAGVSLPVLRRIARALGITVAGLFDPEMDGAPRVVRRTQANVMEMDGWRNHLLTPRPLNNLEVFWIELSAGASTADMPFAHGDSDEIVILLSGEIEVTINDQPFILRQGESITYNSGSPHVVSNIGQSVAEAIVALSPPTM